MKKILNLSLLALFALGLTSCGSSSTGSFKEDRQLAVIQYKFTVAKDGTDSPALSKIIAVEEAKWPAKELLTRVQHKFYGDEVTEPHNNMLVMDCLIKHTEHADAFSTSHAQMLANEAKKRIEDRLIEKKIWEALRMAELTEAQGYKNFAKSWFPTKSAVENEIRDDLAGLRGKVLATITSVKSLDDVAEAKTQIVKAEDFDNAEKDVKDLIKEVSIRDDKEKRHVYLTVFIKI